MNAIPFTPLPELPPPKTVGVDDFAFKKRLSYGTILVDLDQHRPIDLLPDPNADTLADWLKQHPSIDTLARDRSKTYRQGMNQGAPHATQVADRFHLLQNLTGPLQAVFFNHSNEVILMASAEPAEPAEPPSEADSSDPPPELVSPPNAKQSSTHKRRTRFEKIWQLRQNGCTIPEIAVQVGVSNWEVMAIVHCQRLARGQHGFRV